MACADLASPRVAAAGRPAAVDELRRLALRLLAPAAAVHRRLLLRQQLESLPDRLLRDVGVERNDLPALLRRLAVLD